MSFRIAVLILFISGFNLSVLKAEAVDKGNAFKDKVIFIDDQTLEAGVLSEDAKGYYFKIEYGQIYILKKRIKRIQYDYSARTEALPEKALKQRVKLGKMLLDQNMYDEAVQEYEKVTKLKGAPEEAWLNLGKAYNGIRHYEKAENALVKYLAKNKNDTEAKQLLAKVKKSTSENPESKNPNETGAETPIETKEAESKKKFPDHLEGDSRWSSERGSWSNASTVEIVKNKSPETGEDNLLLSVSFRKSNLQGKAKDKAAIRLNSRLDLSNAKSLVFDAYVPKNSPAVKMAIAFTITDKYIWYESPTKLIPSGKWNTAISFDLSSANFKTQGTGWKHNTKLKDTKQVKQMILLIYTKGTGRIFFDDIKINK
jgi:tetratricopeptide (TPR) repeat protein